VIQDVSRAIQLVRLARDDLIHVEVSVHHRLRAILLLDVLAGVSVRSGTRPASARSGGFQLLNDLVEL
jgi:hypothetical protein